MSDVIRFIAVAAFALMGNANAAEAGAWECAYDPVPLAPRKVFEDVLREEGASAKAGNVKSMFDIGLSAYAIKRYDVAVFWYMQAAEKGSAGALVNLGVAYLNGNGVDRDEVEAAKLYEIAVKAGDTQAMANLASLELDGTGLPKDTKGGLMLLNKAAGLSNDSARVVIGKLYIDGKVLPHQPRTAFDLFCKAAQRQNVKALEALGDFFSRPPSGSPDWDRALEWYHRGADLGGGGSLMQIGWAYEHGLGGKQNAEEALRFYKLAAETDYTFGTLNVARAYYEGVGTSVDMNASKSWFEKAAAKGSTEAQNVLRENFQNQPDTPAPPPYRAESKTQNSAVESHARVPRLAKQLRYQAVRSTLLKNGWRPAPDKTEMSDPRGCDTDRPDVCKPDWTEVMDCSGTGEGPCLMRWQSGATIIKVTTVGSPARLSGVECVAGCE